MTTTDDPPAGPAFQVRELEQPWAVVEFRRVLVDVPEDADIPRWMRPGQTTPARLRGLSFWACRLRDQSVPPDCDPHTELTDQRHPRPWQDWSVVAIVAVGARFRPDGSVPTRDTVTTVYDRNPVTAAAPDRAQWWDTPQWLRDWAEDVERELRRLAEMVEQ